MFALLVVLPRRAFKRSSHTGPYNAQASLLIPVVCSILERSTLGHGGMVGQVRSAELVDGAAHIHVALALGALTVLGAGDTGTLDGPSQRLMLLILLDRKRVGDGHVHLGCLLNHVATFGAVGIVARVVRWE